MGGAGLGSGQSGPPGAAVRGPLPKGKHAFQSFSGRGCEALLQGKTPPDSFGAPLGVVVLGALPTADTDLSSRGCTQALGGSARPLARVLSVCYSPSRGIRVGLGHRGPSRGRGAADPCCDTTDGPGRGDPQASVRRLGGRAPSGGAWASLTGLLGWSLLGGCELPDTPGQGVSMN